ncbi:MAG: CDP-alcohol phosphatidyltransferase family protein [Clostridia bacterium]|nr:CDP-alcohol phosphatidyltransferase family protein [Clostridia bacterium]
MENKYENKIFTIPNILSMVRILLIPVYGYLYIAKNNYLVSAIVLAASMLTDAVDGIIARRLKMISTFGKIIDPIADKLTQAAVFFFLSLRWWEQLKWVVLILVLKEGFMLVMGLLHLKKGRMLNGALWAGKICTTVLFVSMGLLVINPNMADKHVGLLSFCCCVAMICSFAFYLSTYTGGNHGVDIVSLRKDDDK